MSMGMEWVFRSSNQTSVPLQRDTTCMHEYSKLKPNQLREANTHTEELSWNLTPVQE